MSLSCLEYIMRNGLLKGMLWVFVGVWSVFLWFFSYAQTGESVSSTSLLAPNCVAASDNCGNVCWKTESWDWFCTLMACAEQQDVSYTCTKYEANPDLLPVTCVQWNDGCNSCFRNSQNDPWACTKMYCENPKPATCTKYDEDPIMCTMQYDPVCASVAVQCIKEPCPAQLQTFWNACMMSANKLATYLHDGECESGDVAGLKPGESFVYNGIKDVLNKSYWYWQFTPEQSAAYTQTIIDKIDNTLQTSKMKLYMYRKYEQIKRFLGIYISQL